MAITRWDPFRELYSLQNQMNRLFMDNLSPAQGQEGDFLTSSSFIPPVAVSEDEHNVTLKFEVPRVDEKDLDIKIENNTLTVRGERKFSSEEKEENFHRIERRYGSFVRSFTLPNTVNADDVHAGYSNGVLEVKLGKRAEAKPKQIKVSASTPAPKTIETGK